MRETTRQIVLLFGVLTLLTSSFIVINTADRTADQTPDNTTDNTTDNIPEPENNTEINETEADRPEGLIDKSIRGFELLVSDIGETTSFLSTDS